MTILLFIAVQILALMLSIGQVQAATKIWIVDDDGPADFHTIQEAISAATSGDTISVKAGTYSENVEVNKQLNIVGDGAEVTFIRAANSSKHAMNITSSNVIVSGFNLSGSNVALPFYASGIRMTSVSNVSILHNFVSHNIYGIYMEGSSNSTIAENIVGSNDWGINLESGDLYNTIVGNDASSNAYYGIVLWSGSSNNTVTRNTASGCQRGITLGYCSYNTIADNNFSLNSYGAEIQGPANNNTFCHNNFVDNVVQAGGSQMPESVNLWDDGYPFGGNYWSGYAGNDFQNGPFQNLTGSDGIGDISYFIDSNHTDNCPFYAPIYVFDAGIWNGKARIVEIASNSTISSFQIDIPNKNLRFDVKGEIGSGFCRVTIPNTITQDLWQDSYSVIVDGSPVEFLALPGIENTFLYFAYQHSTHEVIIVPEFALFILIPLFMMATLLVIKVYRRKLDASRTNIL